MDKIKCQEVCNEDDECKFALFTYRNNKKKRCRKFRACDKMEKSDNAGSLFSKEGKCPGIDFTKSEFISLECFFQVSECKV